MVANRHAQYLICNADDVEWLDEIDAEISTRELSSGEVLLRTEEALPPEESVTIEKTIHNHYNTDSEQ